MVEYYEDERDIQDVPPDEPAGHATVKFNVPMPTVEQVTGEIARQLIATIGDYQTRSDMLKLAREKINDAVDAKINEQVGPLITELLAKPLQPTDGFGNPVGEPTSLQGLIAHQVTQWASTPVDDKGQPAKKDPYGKVVAPRIDWALGQLTQGEMKKAVQVEVDKIKATLKANATASIAKQIAERVSDLVLK